ncbi:MAG: hypothetical protein EBS04_01300 [Chitinophagia bacterium]|nr:hypothetical protein [Chitinophagia bacterium]
MLRLPPIIVCFLSCAVFQSQAQTKVVGECAITYDIHQISMKGDTSLVGQKQIFIKGNSCKTILKTSAFTQTLIFNTQQDTAIILKEIGLNKILQYILYASMQPVNLVASKKNGTTNTLLDYPCETITLSWADGNSMEVTYTTMIIPTVTVYEQAFKEIPGLVLRYQLTTKEGNKILYNANKIDLSPITLNVFEVNKSNYQQIN